MTRSAGGRLRAPAARARASMSPPVDPGSRSASSQAEGLAPVAALADPSGVGTLGRFLRTMSTAHETARWRAGLDAGIAGVLRLEAGGLRAAARHPAPRRRRQRRHGRQQHLEALPRLVAAAEEHGGAVRLEGVGNQE